MVEPRKITRAGVLGMKEIKRLDTLQGRIPIKNVCKKLILRKCNNEKLLATLSFRGLLNSLKHPMRYFLLRDAHCTEYTQSHAILVFQRKLTQTKNLFDFKNQSTDDEKAIANTNTIRLMEIDTND